MHKYSRIYNRAYNMKYLYFVILAVAIAIVVAIGSFVTMEITDDSARRLSRQYSIETAANFLTNTNSHFVLSQQIANSTAISRWMANEDDPDIKARAVEEIIGYSAFIPDIFLMFTAYDTYNIYSLYPGFTSEDIVSTERMSGMLPYSQWFFDARDAELPFALNIQRSTYIDGEWTIHVWMNQRMYYQGNFVGIVTTGTPFTTVFDNIFGEFEIETRRGYIIDQYGLVRADSAQLLEVFENGWSHPQILPETVDNPDLADAIDAHLQTMVDGAFRVGGAVTEAIPVRGDFRYASIAPIIGTNWSVVILSTQGGLCCVTPFFPLMIVPVVLLFLLVWGGTLIMRRVEHEQERRRAEIAEESNLAKSAFLAQMSHEIRTPITAVMGISEIELNSPDLSPHTEEAFAKIHDSASQLLNIVNDVLDLSKIEAGKMELIQEEYEVASMVVDATQLNAVFGSNKGLEFNVSIDENLPTHLVGDSVRIRQIMNNILSNAFKYTESGTVDFSLHCQKVSDECVTLFITISDTGHGMTAEQLEDISIEYSRHHERDARNIDGTGLGMSIVYSMVQMMGAKIDVTSEVGVGTKVVVQIPQKIARPDVLGKELASSLEQLEYVTKIDSKKFTFVPESMPYGSALVVDDVDINLYVAKGLLAFYDLKVETCSSGHEAIKLIKQGNIYDIVFLDHMMSDMNGTEVLQEIRKLGYTKPVVALTANAMIGQAKVFIDSGFDGFLSKPVKTTQLNAILNKLIRDKQPPEVIEAAKSGDVNPLAADIHSYQESDEVLSELRQKFVKTQVSLYSDMHSALTAGDAKTAHRLAHTLKGAAGLICEFPLMKAAEHLECLLNDGKTPTVQCLSDLEYEFTLVIGSIDKNTFLLENDGEHLSIPESIALLNKVAPLLMSQNVACAKMLNELRRIPGAAALCSKIEDFDFEDASEILSALKTELGGGMN